MATTNRASKGETLTRLHITTITVELRKSSKYPIYVRISTDRERDHNLPPIAEDQALRWTVDLPIDVGPQSQVMLQIKKAHRVRVWRGDLGSCVLSDHPDWLKPDPDGAQKEIVQQAERFTVSVKFSPPLGIKGTQLIAERAVKATDDVHGSILGKLGQARSAVETIVSVLEHVEEVHPIAKAALSTLTRAFQFLEEEEQYEVSIRDLASGMADMLSFAETVNLHAKIVQLEDTIAQMMSMVEDASRFILESQSSTAIRRAAVGLISSERRNKIDQFIKHFEILRMSFDRGVAVQILDIGSRTLQVGNQVLSAVSAAEERSLGEQERLLLNELPRAHSAGYDPSGCCMEGTRTQILQDIIDWTNQPTGPTFLWVQGPAGSGKSSIATSTARELQTRNRLGASFFCSRDKPELRDPAFVLPTVASRLAIVFPTFGKAVADQLRKDPHIGESAVKLQYEGLFARPLMQLEESSIISRPNPLVIVIDALDECGSPGIRTILLEYLLEISHLTNWLKVVVTSRPEPDITRVLERNPVCNPFPLPLNDTATYNDILFFTQTRMREITRAKNLEPSDWPGEVRTKQLAELAGGLFVWAETAYKFIASGYIPEDRLNQLLSKTSTPGIYSKLDALYATTLAGAFQESDSDNLGIFRLVVGTIVTVLTPLPVQGLFTLLGGQVSEIGIRSVVQSFRSVLYEDEQNDLAIRVCHLSFVDFITDPLRCQQFFVDICQHHTALATVSLQLMQDQLRFNICDLESSDLFNDQIPDLEGRVDNKISIPLRYSCLHWMPHFHKSSKSALLVERLERFLSQKTVLYWIEALSLLKEIPTAIHGLPLVIDWLQASIPRLASLLEFTFLQDPGNENSQFIDDIHRFVLRFKEPIARSTPHLYISALPFAPTQSLISKRFLPSFKNTISPDDWESFWSPCLQTLEGHRDRVLGVSWSPDGQRLVSGSFDHIICVWDSTTGTMLQQLRGHSGPVTSVSFSPNSRLIASGSWDKTIQIWDVETGGPIFPPILGHTDIIYRVIFSPDGRHLASCSKDTTICIWDVATGTLVLEPFVGHSDLMRTIAYSPDGTRIVSCSNDKTVRVWDVETGHTILGPFTTHTDIANAVDFSPDGRRILSGSHDGYIVIRDSISGAILSDPLQVGNDVLFTKFSPNGRVILSTSLDSKIRVWDTESGVELFSQEHSGSIYSACFSPDGQHFVTGCSDRTVRIWELYSLCPASSISSQSRHKIVYSVAISPDGKYIASGSADQTARVWHADTGKPACAPLRGHTQSVTAVAFSPDGQYILSASSDHTLRLWTVGLWDATDPFCGHTSGILCAAFSPSGHLIISGSRDQTIRLWDPVTGKEVCRPLQGHKSVVSTLDISSDGRLIGSGSGDTIIIWDSVTRHELFDLHHFGEQVCSMAFSPEGRYVSSHTDRGSVRLWDIQTQVVLWKSRMRYASRSPGCSIFSRNGQYLFCAYGSFICILDAETGSRSIDSPLESDITFIRSLAISPNDKHLISCSDLGTICAWDVELQEDKIQQELLPDDRNLSKPVGHDGWVRLQTGDPLLWIPNEYRDGLWKRLLFTIPYTTRSLDCSRFRHGNTWAEVLVM